MIAVTIWLAVIGFIDDYIKVIKKDKSGLAGKFKVVGQVGIGLIVGLTMLFHPDITVRVTKAEAIAENYEIKFVPIIIFIVTGVSNGANLTDGLDGLATGVSAIIGATLGILAYVSGSEELVIFAASFLGACVGFLWFNSYPAKVFMGDTGSLTIGGIIAVFAILIRKEFLIPILCGIFLAETVSVIMQVTYFKYTKKKYGEGRRIFRMSPLHHHYQKLGMHEARIVTRFWIVGIMLAILTIITLKMR
ncbi:UNVERIFIED_CONTAM: hypothetical protein GTU68_028779 [Idotea baltica]|nr:hypothetical protein [Idotea baltica]